MVKKTVETEVDFPECSICGNGIFAGETFFDINIYLSKMTVDNRGGSAGRGTGNSANPLRICEKCSMWVTPSALNNKVLQNIISEVERQQKELEPKKKSGD